MADAPKPLSAPIVELTPEHREKVKQWLVVKSAPLIGKCPVCGARDWSLLDHIIDFKPYHPEGTLFLGGPQYPAVGLFCQNCGNTQFLNAVKMGLVPPGSREPATEPPTPPTDPQE